MGAHTAPQVLEVRSREAEHRVVPLDEDVWLGVQGVGFLAPDEGDRAPQLDHRTHLRCRGRCRTSASIHDLFCLHLVGHLPEGVDAPLQESRTCKVAAAARDQGQ
jgi:hypothetical protein